jgi:hypothetical protein
MKKIYFIFLFVFGYTNIMTAQLATSELRVVVNEVKSNNRDGSCAETGNEEYSAWVYLYLDAKEYNTGCLKATGEGTQTYGEGAEFYDSDSNNPAFETTSESFWHKIKAWENDIGERCKFGTSILNDDDCLWDPHITKYNFKYKSPDLFHILEGQNNSDHSYSLKYSWNYKPTNPVAIPSCGTKNFTYKKGTISAREVTLTQGTTYTFDPAGTNFLTYGLTLKIYNSNSIQQGSFNMYNLGWTPASFTAQETGTYFIEVVFIDGVNREELPYDVQLAVRNNTLYNDTKIITKLYFNPEPTNCNRIFEYPDPVISTCGEYEFTEWGEFNSGNSFPEGINNVYYRLVTPDGEITNGYFLVESGPLEPTITCVEESTKVVEAVNGSSFYTIPDTSLDATASCPRAEVFTMLGDNKLTSLKGSTFPVGTHEIEWTLTYNTYITHCTTTLIVNPNTTVETCEDDKDPPTAVAKNITIQLDATGNATISPEDINDGSSDNCADFTFSLSKTTFDCTNIGANTVTLTVTDASENTASAVATITVEDNVAPVALTKNITIQLDADGKASITAEDVNNGSSDACGDSSLSLSKTLFDCSNAGENTVTLKVEDAVGNSHSATAIVTVVDVIDPVAITQPVTIELGANGTASVTAAQVNNASTDNCAVVNWTLDKTDFDCSNAGENTVVLTVEDAAGNRNTATTVVTVVDAINPVAITQPVTIELGATGAASVTAAQVNNVSTDNCAVVSWTLDKTDFICSDAGANTVTLTVEDAAGNSHSATATVTVVDNIGPVAITRPVTIELGANGIASVTAAQVNNTSTDNCTVVSWELDKTDFDCSEAGENTVTLTVEDAAGNSHSATATVTVVDNIDPNITCVANKQRYVDPHQTYYTIVGTEFDATASDNCEVSSLTYSGGSPSSTGTSMAGEKLDLGENIMEWTAVDASGNTTTCSTMITVEKRPTTLTYTGDIEEQYSDEVNLSATLTDDVSGDGIEGIKIKFTIGTQSTTAITDVNGDASTTMKLTQDPALAYSVKIEFFEDDSYFGNIDEKYFDITPENAIVEYTGQTLQATVSSRDSQATILLSANIQDISANTNNAGYDEFQGDIRNAKVKFVHKEGTFDSGWLNVEDLIDPLTGTVSYSWTVDIGNATSESYTLRIIVDNGYYIRDSSEDDTVITVYMPVGDFITGGGYIVPTDTYGEMASTPGLKTNFGFNVKYNKNGTKLKGHMNVIFRRLESDGKIHVYQIKGNAIQSLGVDTSNEDEQVATFITKSNLTDITDPSNTISLGGNMLLKVAMTDRGEPGANDGISFNLTDGNDLIFSSNWNGITTNEMQLSGGNLVVHSGFSLEEEPTVSQQTSLKSESQQQDILDLAIAPNPSDSDFRVRVISENQKDRVQLVVHSYSGGLVFETSGKPGDEFVFGERLAAGTYIVKIYQANQSAEKIVIKW